MGLPVVSIRVFRSGNQSKYCIPLYRVEAKTKNLLSMFMVRRMAQREHGTKKHHTVICRKSSTQLHQSMLIVVVFFRVLTIASQCPEAHKASWHPKVCSSPELHGAGGLGP